MGTLGRSHVYRTWEANEVELRATDGGPIHVSLDGEVATAGTRIRLAKRPAHLLVYRQADPTASGS